jgi:hypothetical protein
VDGKQADPLAEGGDAAGANLKESKRFFFEKKKQKTFVHWSLV